MGSVHASLLITLKWRLLKGFVKLGISSIRTMEPGIASIRRVFSRCVLWIAGYS